jgi:hypothetical protein
MWEVSSKQHARRHQARDKGRPLLPFRSSGKQQQRQSPTQHQQLVVAGLVLDSNRVRIDFECQSLHRWVGP